MPDGGKTGAEAMVGGARLFRRLMIDFILKKDSGKIDHGILRRRVEPASPNPQKYTEPKKKRLLMRRESQIWVFLDV